MEGESIPLPRNLERLINHLTFPRMVNRTWTITNFVSTLDGVISLAEPGYSGGGDISGYNRHDQALMGLLRSAADAVIVGAGQLRKPPGTMWLPRTIYPDLAEDFAELRSLAHKPSEPLQVVVSVSGELDATLPIFQTPGLDVLILTTQKGKQHLSQFSMSDKVEVKAYGADGEIPPSVILAMVNQRRKCQLALIESGPGLAADFLAERLLDELFLTLAPQVAGRDDSPMRPGFVQGKTFAPFDSRWSNLCSAHLAESHLFLRYRFLYSE